MKKVFLSILLVLSIALFFSCSKKSEPTGPGGGTTTTPTDVTTSAQTTQDLQTTISATQEAQNAMKGTTGFENMEVEGVNSFGANTGSITPPPATMKELTIPFSAENKRMIAEEVQFLKDRTKGDLYLTGDVGKDSCVVSTGWSITDSSAKCSVDNKTIYTVKRTGTGQCPWFGIVKTDSIIDEIKANFKTFNGVEDLIVSHSRKVYLHNGWEISIKAEDADNPTDCYANKGTFAKLTADTSFGTGFLWVKSVKGEFLVNITNNKLVSYKRTVNYVDGGIISMMLDDTDGDGIFEVTKITDYPAGKPFFGIDKVTEVFRVKINTPENPNDDVLISFKRTVNFDITKSIFELAILTVTDGDLTEGLKNSDVNVEDFVSFNPNNNFIDSVRTVAKFKSGAPEDSSDDLFTYWKRTENFDNGRKVVVEFTPTNPVPIGTEPASGVVKKTVYLPPNKPIKVIEDVLTFETNGDKTLSNTITYSDNTTSNHTVTFYKTTQASVDGYANVDGKMTAKWRNATQSNVSAWFNEVKNDSAGWYHRIVFPPTGNIVQIIEHNEVTINPKTETFYRVLIYKDGSRDSSYFNIIHNQNGSTTFNITKKNGATGTFTVTKIDSTTIRTEGNWTYPDGKYSVFKEDKDISLGTSHFIFTLYKDNTKAVKLTSGDFTFVVNGGGTGTLKVYNTDGTVKETYTIVFYPGGGGTITDSKGNTQTFG